MLYGIRGRLIAITGITALGFLALALFGALVTARNERVLAEIREQHLPKMALGPKLEADFEALRRGVQDAAAAQDADALAATRERKEKLLEDIVAAKKALSAADIDAL